MGVIAEIQNDLERGAMKLMAEYSSRLSADAVKLCGDAAEAEDLVSRTFVKALNNIGTCRCDANLYAWMKAIMTNLYRNDLDRPVDRGTQPVDEAALEQYAGADERTDEEILRRSDTDALREALDRLEPDYRQAVALYYFNELTLKEIAALMNVSTSSAARRVRIAKQILAAKLKDKFDKGKKPLAVLAAIALAIGAAFGVTKVVEWARGGDDGESAVVVVDPAGSCADSVAAQREIGVQISQQKEKTNMKTKQVVAAAVGTAALFGVGAGMEVRADEPVTYTEVEYIETLDNASWFDTGVKATDAYGIRVKLMPMQQTPEWRSLVSSRLDDFTFGFYNNLNLYYLRRRGADVTRSGVLSSDEPTVLELESNGQSLGVNSDSIVLFNNAGHNRGSLLRIYECEIFGADGNPILQLQPYVRTQGGIVQHGFCDKLTGLPIANGGTGATKAGPIVMKSDFLSVKGEPVELGEVSPSYGLHRGYSVGQTELCSAPANWTSTDGRTRATCLGYKVYTNEVVYVEGEGNSFTYVHPDCVAGAELVWQWSCEYKVTATAGEGGTVSLEEQWVAEGGSATVEAMAADEDTVFAGWIGDQGGADNPLVLANVRSPLAVTATFATAICVATNGSDEAEGTAASPFATIAHALEVAGVQARATSSTVSVKVGPGTFRLEKELVISDAIRLIGAGRDLTILDGQKKNRVLSINHADAEVSDLTITNGKAYNGGGVNMSAGKLRRCCVSGSSAGDKGGGIYATAGLVSRCLVINNAGANGGGMFMQFMQVSDCIVSNNTATFAGAGISAWGGTLENSLVCENEATGSAIGGGVNVTQGVLVRHCTIVNNKATSGGGVYHSNGRAHDNIIWGNSAANDPNINVAANAFGQWTNNCSSVAVGVDPRTEDPLFKSMAKHDYRLAGSSPYRDAAWGVPTSATDVLGNPRVQNGRADIGAIESDPVEKSANMEIESSGHLDEATVTLTAKATNFDINAAVCYWTFDGRTPTAADHDAEGAVATHVYTNAGPCSVALAVVYDGETFADVKENFLTIAPSRVYFDSANEHPAYPYVTPGTAANDFNEALAAAADDGGTTILVRPGTHVFTSQVTVGKSVRICGEEGPGVTVLDGNGKTSVLNVRAAAATIADLAVANCAGSAAVRMEAGTLTNCVVRNNRAGGVCLANAGLVTGCVISNNTTATSGGGVNAENSGGTLENSLVCGNTASQHGGGVYVFRSLVRFCTIVGNTAGTGGGVYHNTTYTGAAHDNIIWGNSAANDPNVNVSVSGFSRWTNTCSSVAVGVNPRTDDPIFKNAAKGDYRLAGSSPCRDAAWGVPATDADVYGNPRVQNGRADIGAIESNPNEMSANMEIAASGHLDEATVTLTAKATKFNIEDAVCYWTFDGRTPTAANHDFEGAVATHVYGVGKCSAALAVVYDGETFVDVKTDFLTVAPSRIYFDSHNMRSAYPYNTHETAASNLVEAIDAAAGQGGSTVLVVPGTHVLPETVSVEKSVRICGEGSRADSVLDGDGKVTLLKILADGAEISNLVIANGGGNVDASVYMERGVLTNCVVRNGSRGGVSLRDTALVTGCVISNNATGASGGGVGTWGGTLENSLVCGNTAAKGGGVNVYHGTTVRFCTIVNNTATGEGGGVFCAAADWGDMGHDNIIWGNAAQVSPDINTKDVVYLAKWRNICTSVAVGENLSINDLVADPLFQNAGKGDYRLRFASPCRNAAWGAPTTAVDLDGAPRVRFRFPDIGCYECQFGSGLMLQVK